MKIYTWFFITTLLLCNQTLFADDTLDASIWANEAIVNTYTYNYQNYLSRQKEIAKYFTAQAWVDYSKALLASKLLDTVKANAYQVSATASLPPKVVRLNNTEWKADMQTLVLYENPQYRQKQILLVTIHFTNQMKGQGVRGLAITSFQAKVVEAPCKCDK